MDKTRMDQISGSIVDAAMRVHSALGPGLLESAYRACLEFELRKRGFAVRTEVSVPVVYESVHLETGYRADMLVESAVLVEIKGVAKIHPVHEAQVRSYLRLGDWRLGLLLNFHELHLKDGIRRIANRV